MQKNTFHKRDILSTPMIFYRFIQCHKIFTDFKPQLKSCLNLEELKYQLGLDFKSFWPWPQKLFLPLTLSENSSGLFFTSALVEYVWE